MMEYLDGGRQNKIAKVGKTVVRPAGKWTPAVHRVLAHIRAEGFLDAPQPFGYDSEGNEVVSYISGEVSNYPLSMAAASQDALVSAAQLLRAFHEASSTFLEHLTGDEIWLLPPREPVEVICHGDYAPYNVVLHGNQAVAIIDFDTAHPAPRNWDIAYALYRWAPLMRPDNPDGMGSEPERIDRARLFCDVYGLPVSARAGLISLVIERLQALVDFMQAEARQGNEAFQANIADGHHLTYLADIAYLQNCQQDIQKGIETNDFSHRCGW